MLLLEKLTMKPLPFNDDWIKANNHKFDSYRQLAEGHNKVFRTNFTRQQMKNHASLILGIKMEGYHWTKEQEEWIKTEFPKVGTAQEKTDAFNKHFGTKRKPQSIKEKAHRLGACLSEEAVAEYKRKSAEGIVHYNTTVRAKPIGYVGRLANGYPMVKTENGWVSQARYEYLKTHDEIPKGYVVVFLDGNKKNVSQKNLIAIPQSWQMIMSINNFWSEHPAITRTGITWCNLYELLKGE